MRLAMPDQETRLAEFHARLGLKRLNRTWAKTEIFLGLTAVGAGLLLGDWVIAQREFNFGLVLVSLALFVLGDYLALAGHRSHLYQSSNELTAHLVEEIHHANQQE